ncbi:MAG: putative RND superfamily exporter protein [Maribacter sp.]|jgi:predicted RND superfamily exporter protein
MKTLPFLRKISIILFLVLSILPITVVPNLKFSFDFSQFFPEKDSDLIFYNAFVAEFGTDDNFLLVAVENDTGVF